ncbi:MAG: tetratricopeptide repeat protein, partial [Gammaproteobacteria bacterium]|nr:tetratricopeptide repeat protein [Gammaproteobacteria bacterium]
LLLAQIHLNKENIEAAKEVYLKGKENVVSSLKIPLRLAVTYELTGSYDKATAEYRDLYSQHPENLIIINNLASMLSNYGVNNKDLEFSKELIEKLKSGAHPAFFDTIGWVYYKLGDHKNAIQYLSQAVEKSPKVNIFNYHIGMAYRQAGDNINAKLYLEKSLSADKPFKGREKAEAALKEI